MNKWLKFLLCIVLGLTLSLGGQFLPVRSFPSQIVAQNTSGTPMVFLEERGVLEEGDEQLGDGSRYDIHPFQGKAGQSIIISLESNEFDTSLGLLDSEGELLAVDEDEGEGTNSQITITLPADGIYRIVANSLNPESRGRYNLIVREATVAELRKTEADGILQRGIQEFEISRFQEALRFWEESLRIYREIGDRLGEANSLGNLGIAYANLGQYQKAIDFYKQTLEIAIEIGDRPGEAYSLVNLGLTYQNLGQYQRAIDFYQQSLKISRQIGDRKAEARILGNLGNAYVDPGQYQRAIDFYQQSLKISRQIGDRKAEAGILGNLGNAYRSLGQFQRAIDFHQQSLKISRQIGDRLGEANSLGSLGAAYDSLGQYQRAIDFHQQSLEIDREIGYRQGEAISLGNLGSAYYSLGQYQRAIDFHQQSLEIKREIGYRQGEADSLGSLGNAYADLGQSQKAIDFHEQSLKIMRQIGDRRFEAASLVNMGLAYNSLGQSQRAMDFYEQSLEIARQIGDRQHEAASLNNLGLAHNNLKQYPEAEEVLYQAIEIYETLRTETLPDASKISIFETQADSYRNLQQALIAQNKLKPALEIAERGRARAFVELLTERIGKQEKVSPITIDQIQQVASLQKATLVEYSIIPHLKQIYIWVVSPKGKISFKSVDISNTDLSQLVNNTRETMGVRGGRSARSLTVAFEPGKSQDENLEELYSLLMEPIQEFLPTSPKDRIIFLPQNELFLVPFPALKSPTGKHLIEEHTILTAPAIQVLQITQEQRQESSSEGILIVGNPTMPQIPNLELSPLPGAEEKAKAIGELYKTTPLIGDKATKAAVLEKLSRTKIAHFATHGLLDDFQDAQEIGIPGAIALAPEGEDNGLLTSKEILDLNLNSHLIVLSACDTGRGELTGDGVVGLSRSFVTAGVPSIVVSLWSVPDKPTKDLMIEFYRELEKGSDKATALRNAMLKTKEKYPHPRDWAAFTVVGEAE